MLGMATEAVTSHRRSVSHSTVKHHLANARSKVGAAATAQLVWILAPRLPEPERTRGLGSLVDHGRQDARTRYAARLPLVRCAAHARSIVRATHPGEDRDRMASGSAPSGAKQRVGRRPLDPDPRPATPADQERWYRRAFGAPGDALRAALIVLVTAAVTGGLTSLGQQYLPDELRSLANASGTWFAVVMGALVVARPRPVPAIILGVLGLIVMNEVYGVVSRWRGFAYGGGLSSIWNLIALLVGPVAGIAATWLRSPRPALVALGASAPAAVLIGEGLYGLTVVSDTTSPAFWTIELAAGVGVVVVTAVTRLRTISAIGMLVGVSALGAALFYVVYSSL